MGASELTREEFREYTKEAIEILNANHTYLRNITLADILAVAGARHPGFTKGPAYDRERHPEVREELEKYQDKRRNYISHERDKQKKSLGLLETFVPQTYYDIAINNPRKLLEKLKELGIQIEEFMTLYHETKNKLNKANARIETFSRNDIQSLKTVAARNKELERELEKTKQLLEKREQQIRDIQQMAGKLVVRDNHMGNVIVDNNPLAVALTYMGNEQQRLDYMRRMRGKRGDTTEEQEF